MRLGQAAGPQRGELGSLSMPMVMPVAKEVCPRPEITLINVRLAFGRHLLPLADDLLHERVTNLGITPPQLPILLKIEVAAAIDPGLLHTRGDRQRIPAPDDQVGILACFHLAHAVVDPQLLRRIERDKLQGLVWSNATILHRLGGLLIEMTA